MAEIVRDIAIGIKVFESGTDKLDKIQKKFEIFGKEVQLSGRKAQELEKFFTGFRGELLSIGFLFGAIGAGLSSLIRSALDTFGQLGSTLTSGRLAFLELQAEIKSLFQQFAESPAMQFFLNILTDILKKINDLSPGTKNLIAVGIILAAVFFTIAAALAFAGLGFFGLNTFFTDFVPTIAGLLAKLGAGEGLLGILGSIGTVLLILIIAAFILKAAWDENFGDIRDAVERAMKAITKSIDNTIAGAKLALVGLDKLLHGLFSSNAKDTEEGFRALLAGFVTFFLSIAGLVAKAIFSLNEILTGVFFGLIQVVTTFIVRIFGALFDTVVNTVVNVVNFIIEQVNRVFGTKFSFFSQTAFAANFAEAIAQALNDLTIDRLAGARRLTDVFGNAIDFIINPEDIRKLFGVSEEIAAAAADVPDLATAQSILGITGSNLATPEELAAAGTPSSSNFGDININISNDFEGFSQTDIEELTKNILEQIEQQLLNNGVQIQ